MSGWPLTTIVSCAAPGVERGALDAAIELDIDYGGWRAANDAPAIYRERMRATRDRSLARRLNVQDSDGTLLVSRAGELSGVAAFVDQVVEYQRKASMQVCLPNLGGTAMPDGVADQVRAWIREERVGVLHVSGPAEDDEPGIQQATHDLIVWIFEEEVDLRQRGAR